MSRFVAERARPWLSTWRRMMAREDFSAFDLAAAAVVLAPSKLRCIESQVQLGVDRSISGNPFGPLRLMFVPPTTLGRTHRVTACLDRTSDPALVFALLGGQ